jgi:hypothetical protein
MTSEELHTKLFESVSGKVAANYPDAPKTSARDWLFMRKGFGFQFGVASELAKEGAGKSSFEIPLQFVLICKADGGVGQTVKRKTSSNGNSTPLKKVKVGRTLIAVKGTSHVVESVFTIVAGKVVKSLDEFTFKGQNIKIPFTIVIDEAQELGRKNNIRGATRYAYPSEIPELVSNLVAKQ